MRDEEDAGDHIPNTTGVSVHIPIHRVDNLLVFPEHAADVRHCGADCLLGDLPDTLPRPDFHDHILLLLYNVREPGRAPAVLGLLLRHSRRQEAEVC